MAEIWKPIKGYEGIYEISNKGRIKSISSGLIRKQLTDKWGYNMINLSKEGKKTRFFVHRLVASAFLDNPNKLPQINHKDEDKTNNCVENLEWCTQKYNNEYGTRKERIREAKGIKVRCVDTGEVFASINECSKAKSIPWHAIKKAVLGNAPNAHGLMFEEA